ncbi:MAG TPA: fumarylacetoacetate hydrolase family protein [Casimicrobiaceae bacterium]|nr:fumarylacetoacetate hydrolase family protein [Casimicrobiaceae bacterium]
MRLVRYNGGRIGVLAKDGVVDVTPVVRVDPEEWPPVGMLRVIRHFDTLRPDIEAQVASAPALPLSQARLQAPIAWPNKVIAYPINYVDHATEMSVTSYANVAGFFLKASSSLIGPHEAIELPDLPGRSVHHECELAIIIGREGRDIAAADALDHVLGYACLLDITIRGKEERVMRKSYDTFTVLGPCITTADEVGDASDIRLALWVNDQPRQDARTRDLIVDIPNMIALASSAATLCPGDIIATGTPSGVGPIVDGDRVTIEIERVGRMSVPVRQGRRGRNFVFDPSLSRSSRQTP